MYKLAIFDFDGVLNNSFEQVYKIHEVSCSNFGRKISKSEYLDLFLNGSFHESLENFLNFSRNDLEKFKSFKYSIYDDYYSRTKLYIFAKKLVNELKLAGYTLAIVSSAPKLQIEMALKKNNLYGAFFEISGINKQGKAGVINSLATCLNLQPEDCIFITDTCGDIIDGKKSGVDVLAVTWGFHDKKRLLEANPKYVADNLDEINDILV